MNRVTHLKKAVFTIVVILLLLIFFSIVKEKYFETKPKFTDNSLVLDFNPELVSSSISDQFNSNSPQNLFFKFYIRTLYTYCGYYRTYYEVINCIQPEEVKVNTVFNEDSSNRVKMLWAALLDTNFKFENIPIDVPGNKFSIDLGRAQNKQTFSLAKKNNGDWYFTDSNFSDPKTIEKYKDFNDKFIDRKSGKIKYMSIPILAYTTFILGSQGIMGFDNSDALTVLELKWIPEIVRNDYSSFLSYILYKVLESENITISAIPGRTSPDNDVIVIYVSEAANRSIYLEKVYLKDGYKWCFTKEVLNNALEIYEKEKINHSKSDSFWFEAHHFIFNKIPILKQHIAGIPFCLISVIFIGIFIAFIIYKISIRLIKLFFHLLVPDKYHVNLKLFIICTSIIIAAFTTAYLIEKFIIFHLNFYIWYAYFYKIVFGILFAWWLCEIVNIVCSFFTASLMIKKEENFRISFVIEIFNRLLNITIVIAFVGLLLQGMGLNMIHFLAALGIGGLAVALAGKDTIENLFGSIMIAVEKPFKFGDCIVIGGIRGTVVKVGLRSTRIKTFKDSYITIPNIKFITTNVDNMEARKFRRFKTKLRIRRSIKPQLLKNFIHEIQEIVRNYPRVTENDFHIKVNDIGESSINIMVYVYFPVSSWSEQLELTQDLIFKILNLADDMGVKFAFPTQSLYLESNTPKVNNTNINKHLEDKTDRKLRLSKMLTKRIISKCTKKEKLN